MTNEANFHHSRPKLKEPASKICHLNESILSVIKAEKATRDADLQLRKILNFNLRF